MIQVAAAQQLRVSRCRVRGQSFALDLSPVRGVERADRLTPVTDLWPQIGNLPTRAGELPAFSLAGLVGLPESAAEDGNQLFLADTPSGPVGFLVDQTSQGVSVSPGQFAGMPEVVGSPHFPAVVRLEGGVLPWMDVVALLGGRPSREFVAPAWEHRAPAGAASRMLLIPLREAEAGSRPWSVGIPAAAVAELVEPEGVVPVPGAGGSVAGVMPWRNRVIGVVDLGQRLGIAASRQERGLVAVVSAPGATQPFGLLIPRGVRMLKLPVPNRASERPFPGAPDAVPAVIEIHDQSVALLDLIALQQTPAV